MKKQKFVFLSQRDTEIFGTDEINKLILDGWRIVSVTSMFVASGYGGLAIVLEK